MLELLTLPAGRRGLTTAEIIGTVAALTLGVVVGVFVLRPTPTDSEPARAPEAIVDSTTPAGEAEAKRNPAPPTAAGPSVADELRQFKQELLAELRDEVSSQPTAPNEIKAAPVEAGSSSVSVNSAGEVARSAEHKRRGQRTLDYWNQLNDIMLREEEMRRVPLSGLTAANARDFLRRRGKAGKYAVEAIRRLPTDDVDPDVIAMAADVMAWYGRGNELNDSGSFLLNKADTSARRGQPGQQWQDGEKQHIASVAELNRRGDDLRRRMIQKYGLPFPDLR